MANYATDGFSNGVNTTLIGDREKEEDEDCADIAGEEGGEHKAACCGGWDPSTLMYTKAD